MSRHKKRNRFFNQIRENPTKEELEEIIKTEEEENEVPCCSKTLSTLRDIQRRETGNVPPLRERPALPE